MTQIKAGGLARVQGNLSNGRFFATGSALAKDGDYPFYLSLQQGTEVLIGWLNFPAGQQGLSSGTVLWVNNGTNAFAKALQVTAAP